MAYLLWKTTFRNIKHSFHCKRVICLHVIANVLTQITPWRRSLQFHCRQHAAVYSCVSTFHLLLVTTMSILGDCNSLPMVFLFLFFLTLQPTARMIFKHADNLKKNPHNIAMSYRVKPKIPATAHQSCTIGSSLLFPRSSLWPPTLLSIGA